jgi:predicted transcriptional regulator
MEQTVDASCTEAEQKQERQKQEGKRGRTAKRMDVDWVMVKRRYLDGEPAMQIAEELGIPCQTVYSHIRRSRWPKPEPRAVAKQVAPVLAKTVAQQTHEIVKQEVTSQAPAIAAEARKKLNDWFGKVLRVTDTLHRQIEDASERRCEVEEIKSLASSLETVDRIARRTFGLDSPAGSPVSVFSVSAPTISCPVIDVEAIPETAPASGAQ